MVWLKRPLQTFESREGHKNRLNVLSIISFNYPATHGSCPSGTAALLPEAVHTGQLQTTLAPAMPRSGIFALRNAQLTPSPCRTVQHQTIKPLQLPSSIMSSSLLVMPRPGLLLLPLNLSELHLSQLHRDVGNVAADSPAPQRHASGLQQVPRLLPSLLPQALLGAHAVFAGAADGAVEVPAS